MKAPENKDDSRLPRRVCEEELARSAKARREAANRFGMLFREMQLETFMRMLEREGSDEGLVVPIQKPK